MTKSIQLETLYYGAQAVADDVRDRPDESDPVTLAKRMMGIAKLILAEAEEGDE